MNARLTEMVQIVSGFVPVNLATAVNDGDWVSLADFARCAIVFFAGAGSGGEDPVITVTQAKDSAGTSPKALNFTRVDAKAATALTTPGTFTAVTQAAANTYTETGGGALQKMLVIDIKADDLDANNGYSALRASVGDVGSGAQLGGLFYILYGARYSNAGVVSSAL